MERKRLFAIIVLTVSWLSLSGQSASRSEKLKRSECCRDSYGA